MVETSAEAGRTKAGSATSAVTNSRLFTSSSRSLFLVMQPHRLNRATNASRRRRFAIELIPQLGAYGCQVDCCWRSVSWAGTHIRADVFMQRKIKALIVVPENNTIMQPEISALCPELAPIPVARVKRPARTLLLEDLPAYTDATLVAIEPFADRQFDLVIYGCTAAGFLGGPAGNARMVDKLRARTHATVVSTAGAMIDALRHDGVTNTAVVTPYLQPVSYTHL